MVVNVVDGSFFMAAVDSEDGVAIEAPGNLTLDTDFLLGQDLEFGDPDHDQRILGLEKFSGLSFFYYLLSIYFKNSLCLFTHL